MSEFFSAAPRLIKQDNPSGISPERSAELRKQHIVHQIEKDWETIATMPLETLSNTIKQKLERKFTPDAIELLKTKYGIEIPKQALSRVGYSEMDSFIVPDRSAQNPYTAELVHENKRDLRLAKQKNTALDFQKRLATESEKMLGIVLNVWFGKTTKTELSSEYDDQLGGIDMVMEKRNADEVVLAIDAKTYEQGFSGTQNVRNKLRKLQGLYEKNVLPEAKYYKTEQGGYGPSLMEIVVPINKKSLHELSSLLDPTDELKMQLLMNHPYRKTFLQIAAQELENFKSYLSEIRFTDDVQYEIDLCQKLIRELSTTPIEASPFSVNEELLESVN